MLDDGDLTEIASFVNEHHDDAVLLVSRSLLGHDDGISARLTNLSVHGCQVTSRFSGQREGPADSVVEQIDFDRTATSLDDVRAAFFHLVRRARALDPAGTPLTRLETVVEATERSGVHDAHVIGRRQITPALGEITFGGLDRFESLGADEYVRLSVGEHNGFFTVRRFRADAGEIDIWFVVNDNGAISRWAQAAEHGQAVRVSDPRRAFLPPPDTTNVIALGDASGLAAITRILTAGADTMPITAFVAVDLATAAATMPTVIPTKSACGSRSIVLIEPTDVCAQYRRMAERTPLIGPQTYVFGAGESSQMASIRRHLRDEVGLDPQRIAVSGYWRQN